jgi:DNA-binding NtrC family response regulator
MIMTPQKRILIVDDDEQVLDAFKQTLNLEGYVVDTVETGKDAIQKSNTNTYNLALIDIRLPDMQGTQLLTELHETTPKMRKIIVTGYPSQNNAIEAVNKNADAYLVKPILDMNTLLNTIKEQLRKQDEEQQYSEQKVAEFVESRVKEEENKQE